MRTLSPRDASAETAFLYVLPVRFGTVEVSSELSPVYKTTVEPFGVAIPAAGNSETTVAPSPTIFTEKPAFVNVFFAEFAF